MAERKITFVPTICVTRYEGIYREAGAPEWMIERAMGAGEAHWNTLVDAIKREIPIALGTDMLPDDACDETNATVRELEYYAAAGLPPRQVLAAATTVPAAWLGLEDDIGRIEVGKVADIVGCDGDVSTDISSLRRLRFVMKDGVVVRNSA
jgi:imidazolonepropionase-like amidohydrolase